MILTLDVGNTNTKVALFAGEQMVAYFRIATNRQMSSDEYGILLVNLFAHNGVSMKKVEGIIMSSVVPTINFTLEHMCRNYFGMEPMTVNPGIKTGINIKYDNPRELGSDRIANAVAAYTLYGGPCIYIDFGTATTFGAVSAKGEFLGGAICPGLKLAAEALVEQASKLPRFELIKPETVINRTTVTNLQSGLVYGYVGQVTYLVRKFREELGAPGARVIATGGLALLVADETDSIDVLDGLLTLKGLRLIYERNIA
jgi:type III pantothenate kinase